MRIFRLISLTLMSLSVYGHARSQSSEAISSQFVPWSKSTRGNEFRIDVTIDAKYHREGVPVDTGSTGFLLGAKWLGFHDDSGLKGHYEEAFQYLSSSKRYYKGYWYPTTLTFESHLGKKIQSRIPIFLVAEQGRCGSWDGKNCNDPYDVIRFEDVSTQYMGVGFGRWSTEQPCSTAEKNPFLNVIFEENDTNLRSGYHLSLRGVTLGVTPTDLTTKGFKTIQLSPQPHSPSTRTEWHGTPACVVVNDSECFPGTALFDSGLRDGYLGVKRSVTDPIKKAWQDGKITRYVIVDGVKITLKIGPPGQKVVEYSFTVGDYSQRPQTTPRRLRVSRPHGRESFVNTAYAFFNGFELIFDEKSGVVGIREVPQSAAATLSGSNPEQKPIMAEL